MPPVAVGFAEGAAANEAVGVRMSVTMATRARTNFVTVENVPKPKCLLETILSPSERWCRNPAKHLEVITALVVADNDSFARRGRNTGEIDDVRLME